MDIVEFLTRCLDEDQARAEAAHAIDPAPWVAPVTEDGSNHLRDTGGYGLVIADDGVTLWYAPSGHMMTAASARHVAAHDPTRVLADIAAKRKLLANHQGAKTRSGRFTRDGRQIGEIVEGYASCGPCPGDGPCETQLLLAAPYADRPGFNPDWRIEA